MTVWVLGQAAALAALQPVAIEVRFEGGDAAKMAQWLGPRWTYRVQGPGDIGARMDRALSEAFTEGVPKAVLIGADIPDLSPAILEEAFARLEDRDLVIGPAADGGYYLIGTRRDRYEDLRPYLFNRIDWGTKRVLRTTLAAVAPLGLKIHLLPTLQDIDRPEDLTNWRGPAPMNDAAHPGACISVIIPTLNEADHLAAAVRTAMCGENVEVIVADGGSTDATAALARRLGARLIQTAPGRAQQMNAAAVAACGPILLFLHADTRLPDRFDRAVRRTLRRPGTAAGAFGLRIDLPSISIRWIETGANRRSRLLGLPYGDQAIFLHAAAFRYVGGFPALPIMEDFVMVRRLRQLGRVVTVNECVLTSGRRWQRHGVLRTTVLNQIVVAGFYLGIAPDRLARWYRGKTL
jgi:rSAM/selenodomain-associated transferase 2/rSAM/selenodomain-associated transferase 1